MLGLALSGSEESLCCVVSCRCPPEKKQILFCFSSACVCLSIMFAGYDILSSPTPSRRAPSVTGLMGTTDDSNWTVLGVIEREREREQEGTVVTGQG